MAGEADPKGQERVHKTFAVQDAERRQVVESYRVESHALNDGHGKTGGVFKTADENDAMEVGQKASMVGPNHQASVWRVDHTNATKNRLANFKGGQDVTPAPRLAQLRMPDPLQPVGHGPRVSDFASRVKQMVQSRSKGMGMSL